MKEISQAITAVQVKTAESTAETAQQHNTELLDETVMRPDTLIGSTYKIKPPVSDHALYITINDILLNAGTEREIRRPFEIFVNSKNMEFYAWVVALTRVISAVFRKGGDCAFLVEELKAVFDPKGGYYQRGTGVFMPSVVADIGHIIERHLQQLDMMPGNELEPQQQAYIEQTRQASKQANDGAFPAGASQCKKCHQHAVILLDGCATCLNCGDSKCG